MVRMSYPPMPIPTGFIDAETVAGVTSKVETVLLPWYVVETVSGVESTVSTETTVFVVTETTAGVQSDAIFIRDNIIAETLASVASETTLIPVGVITSETVAAVHSEAVPVPLAIGAAETYAEVFSSSQAAPVAVVTATTTAGVTSEATLTPVVVAVADTIAPVLSEGTITAFTPMGAIRAADSSITATTPTKTTGWTANPSFPGTVLVSNGIQVNASKEAVLNFSGTFYWSWTGTMNVAAYVDGVQRGVTHSWNYPNGYVNTPHSGSIPITVASGEVVDLYFWAAIGFAVTIRADAKWSVE